MKKEIKQLRRELFVAILAVTVSFIAISSSTYAWYVSNRTVQGTTSSITAQADGAVLQIGSGKVQGALTDTLDTRPIAVAP